MPRIAEVCCFTLAKVEYSLVQYERAGQQRLGVVASELRERVMGKAGAAYSVVRAGTYDALLHDNLGYRHPFIDRAGCKNEVDIEEAMFHALLDEQRRDARR